MSYTFSPLATIAPGARVLVAGGTGFVGSTIVQALLNRGSKVVVSTRCEERFCQLMAATDKDFRKNLSVVVGDLRTEQGARSVFDQVTGHCKGVQHVVAALRGNRTWWQAGRMVDQSLPEFFAGAREEVTGHYLLMRLFLPYLEKVIGGSTYTIVTGYPSGERAESGTPSSLVCLASGTLCGLAEGARSEHKDSKVAVSEINLRCTLHKELDCDVCAMGSHHVGNDLIGSVVISVAGCGARRRVVISGRDDAIEWAKFIRGTEPFECALPCPPLRSPKCPSTSLNPCPKPCPTPCPKPCPTPSPPPCPPPCPKPCPTPCPKPCPKPCPTPCPKPCPKPCPTPCPKPCPTPCPPPCPNPCAAPCPKPCPTPCPKPCPTPCPPPCPPYHPPPCPPIGRPPCPPPCPPYRPPPCPSIGRPPCPPPCPPYRPPPCPLPCPPQCRPPCPPPCPPYRPPPCPRPCPPRCPSPCPPYRPPRCPSPCSPYRPPPPPSPPSCQRFF